MMVLPLLIMGILMVLGGMFSLLLPETLHQVLPNTLQDGENFGKGRSTKYYCNCCPRLKKEETKTWRPPSEPETESLNAPRTLMQGPNRRARPEHLDLKSKNDEESKTLISDKKHVVIV